MSALSTRIDWQNPWLSIAGGASNGEHPVLRSFYLWRCLAFAIGVPLILAVVLLLPDWLFTDPEILIKPRIAVVRVGLSLFVFSHMLPILAAITAREKILHSPLLPEALITGHPEDWLAQAIRLRVSIGAISAFTAQVGMIAVLILVHGMGVDSAIRAIKRTTLFFLSLDLKRMELTGLLMVFFSFILMSLAVTMVGYYRSLFLASISKTNLLGRALFLGYLFIQQIIAVFLLDQSLFILSLRNLPISILGPLAAVLVAEGLLFRRLVYRRGRLNLRAFGRREGLAD